jgi:hypothetical protein
MPTVADWSYGFGDYDAQSRTIAAFTPLTTFTNRTIRGGKVGATDVSGLEITQDGGTPAREKALVRRWIAPADGKVAIYAELAHTNKEGTGVVCRIVSSRSGLLGEWKAANSSTLTLLSDVAVQRGDTLDFTTVNQGDPRKESFTWAPTITMPGMEMPGMPGMAMRWDARADFMDPLQMPQPIGPWEELAHVLLMSNEFARAD